MTKALFLHKSNYCDTNSTIVAIINISVKTPNDTPKPTPESIASLRRHCMFFPSNGFIVIPPILLFIIRQHVHKSYIEKENSPSGKESTHFGQRHEVILISRNRISFISPLTKWESSAISR